MKTINGHPKNHAGHDVLAPQLPVKRSSQREDEEHDREIMEALLVDDEKPGIEPGTDESLNDGNSALSENPSNGKFPKDAALD
jgi:hypothetical protein